MRKEVGRIEIKEKERLKIMKILQEGWKNFLKHGSYKDELHNRDGMDYLTPDQIRIELEKFINGLRSDIKNDYTEVVEEFRKSIEHKLPEREDKNI